MENERLKTEAQSATQVANKKNKGDDGSTKGCELANSELSISGKTDGVITEILGKINCPFILSNEVMQREETLKTYFRDKLTALAAERQKYESMTKHHIDEVSFLVLFMEGPRVPLLQASGA